MVLGPGVKTGLNIMMDNPGQLGADLVAGLNEYPVPFIVIDMGTATTVSVVNSKKQYIRTALQYAQFWMKDPDSWL